MSFYNFAKTLVYGFIKLFYKVEFKGLENIPQDGAFVVVANHRSLVDPIFIAVKCKRQFHFMAKSELFFFPFKYVMRGLGAFPVHRGHGDNGAVQTAEKILSEGKILSMFPEGTRSKTGKPLPVKSGVARIAYHTKADILPVGITFKGKLTPFKKVTVTYGKLIKFEELNISEGKSHDLKQASEYIMEKIIDLVDMNVTLGVDK